MKKRTTGKDKNENVFILIFSHLKKYWLVNGFFKYSSTSNSDEKSLEAWYSFDEQVRNFFTFNFIVNPQLSGILTDHNKGTILFRHYFGLVTNSLFATIWLLVTILFLSENAFNDERNK